jgi:polysaccharide biosynthesis transport protein
MAFDLKFYLALLIRRLPLILIIVALGCAVGLTLAFTLPTVYRAEARLLFESPQIPDELAASTVRSTADENLMTIQQRLLTRANLLELSQRFGLHPDPDEMTEEKIVEDMRMRVGIYMPPMVQSTGVVSVSFGAPTPQESADVTNALVEQILAQNVELRTAASGNTLEFFQQEVQRISEEMAAQNAKILEFEEANRDSLPESLTYRRSRQAALQERLLLVDRELASLRDRRQRLTELYDRTGRLAASLGDVSPEQAELEELRQELASALVIFSPQNPRVRALQTQVAAMEEAVRSQLGTDGEGSLSTFDLQMADIDGQISFLAEQKVEIEEEQQTLQATIDATPANSIVLAGLQSDYDNLRVQYDQAVASLAEARMGDRIEETDRGQRVSVLEPAVAPLYRAEPNRKALAVSGFGVGVLAATLLVLLLELLNRTVRRPAEMISALGITPFGTVPYMQTRQEIRHHRIVLAGTIAAILIGVPLLLYVVHVTLLPIGTLITAVADRVGLGDTVRQLMPGTAG